MSPKPDPQRPLNILVMNRQYHEIFGGVEYMSTSLVNEMVKRGHNGHLLSLDQEGAEIKYDLDPSITWHKVSTVSAKEKATWSERYDRIERIRRILTNENIDVAVGFQDGAFLSLAVSALHTKIPVVAAERNAPTRFDFIKEGKFRQLRYNSFRLAAAVTVQCPSYVDLYPSYLREHMCVIPNPIFPVSGKAEPRGMVGKKKTLLTVGRISYQKNFYVLIHAFSEIVERFPEWRLVIVGDGEGRDALEQLIARKKLESQVTLVGYTKDPSSYYASAQLFCLPSRWEGFPNALAEAMSYGLPSVGFEGCAGVSDLIKNDVSGKLAQGNENHKSLTSALSALMSDDDARVAMGQAALKQCEEFTPSKVYDMWEDLFYKVKKK